MQRSALQGIAEKAGSRLPILRGKDKGLPKSQPVFDPVQLREKNIEIIKKRAKMRIEGNV